MSSLKRAFQRIQSPLVKSQISLTRHASSATAAAQSTGTAFKNTSSFPVANDKQSSENQENKEAAAATKTVAEFDEELRLKLEGRSGEGGEAGLELEDGKPAAMKRGVKNNMFRLI